MIWIDTRPISDRSVAENSAVGTAVGAPVTATDPGFDGRQETLTYGLGNSGGSSELRHRPVDTGQIRVKDELDYEEDARRTHQVMVSGYGPVRRTLQASRFNTP